jgi:trans-2,3-dihydro-3-hydroxyanthranilate isomerase
MSASQELPFFIVDVFGESRYSGNQLAVVLNAGRLRALEMQRIAREFNFSESTFITSSQDSPKSFDVRIFTPHNELPFAGHPTLGTAYTIQRFIIQEKIPKLSLNLKVGEIPVIFAYSNGKPSILWMKQREPSFGKAEFDPGAISKVLGIQRDEIDTRFPVREVSTGVPFFIVPLKTLKSLRRCKVNRQSYLALVKRTEAKSILVFSPEAYKKTSDLAVRVFTEYYGIPEDPATGSGNGCLAAYLCKHKYFGSDKIDLIVDQGYEVGRPSKLYLKASKAGKISVSVGGRVFEVARGTLTR